MAMYEGNWKCSNCGGAITQLPFQPRSESGLTCRDCYFKEKDKDKAEQPVAEMQTASEPQPDEGVPDFDESFVAGEPMPADDAFAGLEDAGPAAQGEKPKFEGSWSCAVCGGIIASLPFEPRSTENLKCIECFKEGKS